MPINITEQTAFGQSRLLDDNSEVRISGTGDLVISDQYDSMLQSLRLRLLTPKDELYWDSNAGINWAAYEQSKMTPEDMESLAQEIEDQVEQDFRIESGNVTADYDNRSRAFIMLLELKIRGIQDVVKLVIDREVE